MWPWRLDHRTWRRSALSGRVRRYDPVRSIILRELMRAFDLENCIVSKNGIREGAVLLLAQGKDPADGIC